jgi:peptidyl-tRNA hydrolase
MKKAAKAAVAGATQHNGLNRIETPLDSSAVRASRGIGRMGRKHGLNRHIFTAQILAGPLLRIS